MRYPGGVVRIGELDAAVVKALKTALNRALALRGGLALRLDADNPRFGPQMQQAVRLFQARHLDLAGQPLKIDGEVGPISWAALFGAAPAVEASDDPLLAAVLGIAASQLQVREQPRNSNRGPEVDEYLRRAGVRPGLAWCCAFTYWCFDEGARLIARDNPMLRTAGCLAHWNGAPARGAWRLTRAHAIANPALLRPGQIFIMDFGGGLGHTGFVEAVMGGQVRTLEGNTDASQTREGGGVYRLTRKIADINKGFIDYGG